MERAHTAPACPHSKGSKGWPTHGRLGREPRVGERSARDPSVTRDLCDNSTAFALFKRRSLWQQKPQLGLE